MNPPSHSIAAEPAFRTPVRAWSRPRYLRQGLWVFLAVLAGAALWAALVDPYRVFRLVERPGFNMVKPRPDHDLAQIKLAAIDRLKPDALILGNSRVEVGLDPHHASWAEAGLNAYSLALPGVDIATSRAVLNDAYRITAVKRLVEGVEFLDFLVGPNESVPRLADGGMYSRLKLQHLRLKAALTLAGQTDAFMTLLAQRSEGPKSMTDRGFNPLLEYRKIARAEGYYAMFRQRLQENAQNYVKRPKTLQKRDGSKPSFEMLDEILGWARRHGTRVDLVIYPYHAQILELFRHLDMLPLFMDWKKQLAAQVQAARAAGTDVRLWDFSGYHAYACEAVPARGDKSSVVAHYWESGHFKKELGDLMLARMLRGAQVGENFGIALDAPDAVDSSPAFSAAARAACFEAYPGMAAEVESVLPAAAPARPPAVATVPKA
ncbi:MAG: hypothetical protein JNJ60_16285 [Rhodocyclaceae bacterium]|nr:hypothetical protein [Rhodocyclaceae bacterium]